MKKYSIDLSILFLLFGIPLQTLSLIFIYLQQVVPTHYLSKYLTPDMFTLVPFFYFYNLSIIVIVYFLINKMRLANLNISQKRPRLMTMYFIALVALATVFTFGSMEGPRSNLVETSPILLILSWILTIFPALLYLKSGLRLTLHVFVFLLVSMFVNHNLGGFGGVVKGLILLASIRLSYNFKLAIAVKYAFVTFCILLIEPIIFGHFDKFTFNLFNNSYFDRYVNSVLFLSAVRAGDIVVSSEHYASFIPFARYAFDFESTRDVFNGYYAQSRYLNGFSFPVLYSAEFVALFSYFSFLLPILFVILFFTIVKILATIKIFDFGLIVFLYTFSNLPFMLSSYSATFYKALSLGVILALLYGGFCLIIESLRVFLPKKYQGDRN